MTFTMPCPNAEPHPPHEFVKRWRKRLLPFLRNPDSYPGSWNAKYHCRGVEEPDDETWTDPDVRCPFCKSANVLGIGWGSRYLALDDMYDYENWHCQDCQRGWER